MLVILCNNNNNNNNRWWGDTCGVAVALHLGLDLGAPHTCRCGALVDARGQHGFDCKQAPSRIARHQRLSDLMSRALVSAGVPATKEPVGLTRRDGKRPDGTTLIRRRWGKLSVWDVKVVSTVTDSYVATAARGRGLETWSNCPQLRSWQFKQICLQSSGKSLHRNGRRTNVSRQTVPHKRASDQVACAKYWYSLGSWNNETSIVSRSKVQSVICSVSLCTMYDRRT